IPAGLAPSAGAARARARAWRPPRPTPPRRPPRPRWPGRPRSAGRRPPSQASSLFGGALLDSRHGGDSHDLVVRGDPHNDHALSLPADLSDRSGRRGPNHATGADVQNLLFGIADPPGGDELADAIGDLQRED